VTRGTDIHPLYQRGIRWDQVQDIHFVWVKVSDGGAPYSATSGGVRYVPDTHVGGAHSRGIPVGGYHYAQLNPGPEAQADVLVGEIRRLGAVGVTPMLDLEAPFNPDGTARDFGVRFCNRLVAAGFRPAVYMNASFARALRPDTWEVPGLVIVVARYGAKPEAPGSSQYVGRYDVHQYSSGGALPGSAGAVDLDESFTDTLFDAEANMPFTPDDFRALMWGNIFDTNGNRNFAGYVKDMSARIDSLTASVNALTQLIANSGTNGVTTEQVAAALQGTLAMQVAPIVREEVTAALGPAGAAQADAITDAVVAKVSDQLGKAA